MYVLRAFLFFTVVTLASCAGTRYSDYKKAANNRFTVQANTPRFELRTRYNGSVIATSQNGSITYSFPKLKKKYLKLEVSSPNYEPVSFKLNRVVRRDAWWRSFTLGMFTYFAPFLFDYPNPNFYKLHPRKTNITLSLKYSKEYAHQQFLLTESSGDLNSINAWLREFQGYDDWANAIELRDSIELSNAMARQSEAAIDEYIRTHPQAHNLKEAMAVKNDMAAAREAFTKATTENTVDSYTKFLEKYPTSLHTTDAKVKLVDAAEKQALSSNSLNQMEAYIRKYLLPNARQLSSSSIDAKRTNITRAMDAQLINEFIPGGSSNGNYQNLSSCWKRYMTILREIPEYMLLEFRQTENLRPVIYKILFEKLKTVVDLQGQNELTSRIMQDFPDIGGGNNEKTLIRAIVDKTPSGSGSLRLFGVDYLSNYFDKATGQLAGRKRYYYKGNLNDALKNITVEELEFSYGKLTGTNKAYRGQLLDFSIRLQNSNPVEISYFQSGDLVKTVYFMDGQEAYAYEYEGDVNLSINALDDKIREGDSYFRNGEYDAAISAYQAGRNNTYPAGLPQNTTLDQKIERTIKKREDYLAMKRREEEMGRYCGIKFFKPSLDFTYVDNRKMCKCCNLFETGSNLRSNYDIQREKAYCEISYLEGYLDKHWKQTGADSAHIKGDKRMFEEYKQKNYGKYTEGLAGLYYIAWFAQNIFAQILLGSGPDRTYWPIDKYDTPFGDYCSNRCKNDYRCQ